MIGVLKIIVGLQCSPTPISHRRKSMNRPQRYYGKSYRGSTEEFANRSIGRTAPVLGRNGRMVGRPCHLRQGKVRVVRCS